MAEAFIVGGDNLVYRKSQLRFPGDTKDQWGLWTKMDGLVNAADISAYDDDNSLEGAISLVAIDRNRAVLVNRALSSGTSPWEFQGGYAKTTCGGAMQIGLELKDAVFTVGGDDALWYHRRT